MYIENKQCPSSGSINNFVGLTLGAFKYVIGNTELSYIKDVPLQSTIYICCSLGCSPIAPLHTQIQEFSLSLSFSECALSIFIGFPSGIESTLHSAGV